MKKDIDTLMEKNAIDALLITGAGQHNPAMVYLTGGSHLTSADIIKRRGEKGILFHGSMERDEAAKSGLPTRCYDLYPYEDLKQAAKGDSIEFMAQRYTRMFQDSGVTRGNVALYGLADISQKFSVFRRVEDLLPGLKFIGYVTDPILMTAMMTKEEQEITRIKAMGKITTQVVRQVSRYLQDCKLEGENLLREDGQILTIGDVKRKINLWLAEAGVENPENTIFAIGHDAGVPHSQGNNSDPISLGKTIVFDIYPCEVGGGYYYDFTRTWCLGYAPPEIKIAYAQVKEVYDTLISELSFKQNFSHYQKRTCEMFEAMGHPTIFNNPATQEGYVHSIGHGLGLHLHEMPFSGASATLEEVLSPGVVFTIEPGLYYPDKGYGIRIEDSYYVTDQGTFEKLADFPYDLVLPMNHDLPVI